MPIPCPCCKASNDAGPACRRCKADLSLLFAVEADRAAAVEEARRLAAQSRFPDALSQLERAAQLRRGDDVSRLKAAVLLLARDFPAARRAYHELASRSTPAA
jgi:Flp pilus assembly protein TadD